MATLLEPTPIVTRPHPERRPSKGSMFLLLLRTTDHKLIGRMYFVTSFAFFALGGLMALIMRAELARPGAQFAQGGGELPDRVGTGPGGPGAVRRRRRPSDHACSCRPTPACPGRSQITGTTTPGRPSCGAHGRRPGSRGSGGRQDRLTPS